MCSVNTCKIPLGGSTSSLIDTTQLVIILRFIIAKLFPYNLCKWDLVFPFFRYSTSGVSAGPLANGCM